MASFKYFLMLFTLLIPRTAYSIPFVVFHGILNECNSSETTEFTNLLSDWSGSQGYCIEIGNGVEDSVVMPLLKQIDIACEKVKEMSHELSEGYNIVGLSQGNMVARGVVEFCDGGPPVRNYISFAGPQAGVGGVPQCEPVFPQLVCDLLETVINSGLVYGDAIQESIAPSNYFRDPTDLENYRKGCKFLPKLNNEFDKNSTYKERLSSLDNFVLIKCDKDQVLVPIETSWFGYFPDGSFETILPPQETTLYKEDWIGLKTLDEAGKLKFYNVAGNHLEISYDEMQKYIVPYLLETAATAESSLMEISRQSEHEGKTLKLYASN